jgi:hypothetical protein
MPPRLMGLRALCAIAAMAAMAALPIAGASAASKPKLPKIASVAPLKLGIGDMLTIRGTNFRAGTSRNSVVFKRDGSRAVFVKAGKATRTRIDVRVPASLAQFLPRAGGNPVAGRFRLRVLAQRFSRAYTALTLSPSIGPANALPAPGTAAGGKPTASGSPTPAAPPAALAPPDCDGDGTPDGDDDDDLLSDTLEIALKLAPCDADSDGDGMSDGFEYQSAIDLNNGVGSLPYPGKRPYPNPLSPDANTDYDGDGLIAGLEYALWRYVGPHTLPLAYSAGLKRSSGPVDDDVRDADGDALMNWTESNGPMVPGWWENVIKEAPYAETYAGTSPTDPDGDGDGVLDGADDQDFDGWSNISELSRAHYWVHPFNPCLPDYNSPTCTKHPLFDSTYPPFPLPEPLPPSPLLPPPPVHSG